MENGKKSSKLGLIVLILLIFVLGGATGYLGYEYYLSKKELDKYQDPDYLAELQSQQVNTTITKLGEIMLLPEGEPTVATITDADALRSENEAFYKNAQNGDKLIIYSEQAILFREEESRIINVAPVYIDNTETEADSETEDTGEEDEEETKTTTKK